MLVYSGTFIGLLEFGADYNLKAALVVMFVKCQIPEIEPLCECCRLVLTHDEFDTESANI